MEMSKLNARMDPELCREQGGDDTAVSLKHNEDKVPSESV